MAVDAHRATHDRGIGVEIPAPEAVAEDNGGIQTGLIAELPGREQASQFRAHSQHVEVVGCHRFAKHALRVIEGPDEKRQQVPRYGDSLQRLRVIAVVTVIRVGDIVAFPGSLIAFDRHEAPAGVSAGQRAEQHSMNPTEHGGIGGNPERQSKDGERAKARTTAQRAPAVAQVMPKESHFCSPGGRMAAHVDGHAPSN